MDIGIIGAGKIGQALASRLREASQSVKLGTRNPAADDLPGGVSVEEALQADVVILAVPGAAVSDFFASHVGSLANKLVIDATNSVGAPVMHHLADAAAVPGIRYARAFNSLGVENILQPVIDGVQLDMFFAAPEPDERTVSDVISAVGFRPIWLGAGAPAADAVDGATRLWFALAMGRGYSRHLGFKVLA